MQSMNSLVKTRQMKTDQKKMLMFVRDLKTRYTRNKLSPNLYCAFQYNSFRGTKCVNCCSYNLDHIMSDVSSCRSLADTNPIQTKLLCQVTFMQSRIMGYAKNDWRNGLRQALVNKATLDKAHHNQRIKLVFLSLYCQGQKQ